MKQIIFIIGLPGSGKTTLIKNEFKDENQYHIFDDVKLHSVFDCSDFCYSRNYPEITQELKKNEKNIVISDVDFCREEGFTEANSIINWWVNSFHFNYDIRSIFFENSPVLCENNIKNQNFYDRKKKIDKYKDIYNPEKIKQEKDVILPVYQKSKNE